MRCTNPFLCLASSISHMVFRLSTSLGVNLLALIFLPYTLSQMLSNSQKFEIMPRSVFVQAVFASGMGLHPLKPVVNAFDFLFALGCSLSIYTEIASFEASKLFLTREIRWSTIAISFDKYSMSIALHKRCFIGSTSDFFLD